MNLTTYQEKKRVRAQAEAEAAKSLRVSCARCRKTLSTCYCAKIVPFSSGPKVVILIHPKENRKRIGTGRLTYLCIKNSTLVEGVDFTNDETLNALLKDDRNWPVVLYPGRQAIDISENATETLEGLVPSGKTPVIIVIDGTWLSARKMLRLSANLHKLPQIKFTPPNLSIYQIRRQPGAICFSSVEAVHFMVDQLKHSTRWPGGKGHANLIEVFRHMIDQQLSYVKTPGQAAARGKRVAEKNAKFLEKASSSPSAGVL